MVGLQVVAVVGDLAMNQTQLLAVLGDVLELDEELPLALVPVLHASQAEGTFPASREGSQSFSGPWLKLVKHSWSRSDSGSWEHPSFLSFSQSMAWLGSWSRAQSGSQAQSGSGIESRTWDRSGTLLGLHPMSEPWL